MKANPKSETSTNKLEPPDAVFEPRSGNWLAAAVMSFWIGILSLPMLTGHFVARMYNDQYASGYGFRDWAADFFRRYGEIPLWNSEIFGGMPFVAGMHGDIFYPTAWLRWILPVHTAMNIGFVVHYILAGFFLYLFLRAWKLSWVAAVGGGLAYQLSGVIGSYVSPGHDGKLFVTAMVPLGLWALTIAIRDRRLRGYSWFAVSVALAMLSPHPQMAQYYLIAAGIYAIYLTFGSEGHSTNEKLTALGVSLMAVIVGVGVSLIQYLPFYAYIPFSPRSETAVQGFAWSSSFGIPWSHVPELLLSRFSGESFSDTYWGANGIKYHSEYLGLPAVALAALGAVEPVNRRMKLWLLAIASLFLLVALGAATPFFRLWWSVVPFANSMRAPGMALYLVSFVVAVLAAHGIASIERKRGNGTFAVPCLVAGGAVALLAVSGVLGAVADSVAIGLQQKYSGFPFVQNAQAAQPSIRLGGLFSGLALAVVGGLTFGLREKKITALVASLGIVAVVSGDLFLNARPFWGYSRVQDELFADDEIKTYLKEQPRPFRVWNVGGSVYKGAALMADDITQWFGHHGNELDAFDRLLGIRQPGAGGGDNQGSASLLDLYAVKYLLADIRMGLDSVEGFRSVMTTQASSGVTATLLERIDDVPYARVVPVGIKFGIDTILGLVPSAQFPTNQVVVFEDTVGIDLPDWESVLSNLPPPSNASVRFDDYRPGLMHMSLDGQVESGSFLLISENYYPDWVATVDGNRAQVLRGNGALLAVALPPGARNIELRFVSPEYKLGRALSVLSLLIIGLGFASPSFLRRRVSG